ncbi:A24 family peptidase [Streptomyces sp. BK239]|uniref:prepilin peptidase n=1 Tax=Streptomyces sp. BK239 TaxID=2512155 RepID=UPI00102D25CC|nr:leader peptidase (prepilin peptidase)/N-methyltransferase [Streptomyces sp. BK239]
MNGLGASGAVALLVVAAVWGAVVGALLPRAAYRFSVASPPRGVDGEAGADGAGVDGAAGADGAGVDGEEGSPVPGWRDRCPQGHPVRGWIGPARCPRCAEGTGAGVGRRGRGGAYGPGGALFAGVTAGLCAVLGFATGPRPELAVWLLLAPVGVLLAVVDLRVQRLPDPLTLPFAATALALLGVAALLPEHAGDWTTALLASLALGAGYLVLHLVNPGGMGFGDVKLALGAGAVLGWYGWATVMLGTFAGFLLGALYGGALLAARKADRKTAIPFGPFLIAGAYVGLLLGAYTA